MFGAGITVGLDKLGAERVGRGCLDRIGRISGRISVGKGKRNGRREKEEKE